MNYASMEPAQVRQMIREGSITGQTAGMCNGYAQANLCVLPQEYAYDFLLFAHRNPAACPVLEVSDPGDRLLHTIAKDADIATDFPKYRIYVDGVMTEEVTDASSFWRDDLVSFLIGCSFRRGFLSVILKKVKTFLCFSRISPAIRQACSMETW